jgi:hypothetical protein
VKVLSLEKTALGKADGINGPAGLFERQGEHREPPRGPSPYRASQRDYVVTKEIRQSALMRRTLGQV